MNMTKPVLYSFRRCPYAMRARMAIALTAQGVELREIILRDKPTHMVALSAKGTVPVLWLGDDKVIDESLDVMKWALRRHPLIETADWDLIAHFDDVFKFHLDRYKYAARYEGADAVTHRTEGVKSLLDIEQRLSHNKNKADKNWLSGEDYGFTDLAILPFVRQFRIADMKWFDEELGLPHVQNWLAHFLTHPLFLSVMKKYPVWQEGESGINFP